MAAIAGMILRVSMPRNAPRQNAASVQAANAMPRVSNTVAASTFMSSWDRNGSKNHVNSWLNAQAGTVMTTASMAILAIVRRTRPTPCVQAYLKVPVSSSRARSGAPANMPRSTGRSCIRMLRVFPRVQSVPLKVRLSVWQAAEPCGWQAVRAA